MNVYLQEITRIAQVRQIFSGVYTFSANSFKCKQCDYASSDASDLRRHFKIHTGLKSLACIDLDGFEPFGGSPHLTPPPQMWIGESRHRKGHQDLVLSYRCML